MRAYYNEVDTNVAAWLRELIANDLIAYGDVDERSIEDVTPGDLTGYTQCHFFAGIGVWSYALRQAGWPDDKRVWTGSCPCQPFSTAGNQAGFADERHLWPAWHWLISQCQPDILFGEQVANGADQWIDLVSTDLEGAGYAFGAVDIPACGVGAPHIRQRRWFVAERLANSASVRHDEQLPATGAAVQGQRTERERQNSGPKQSGELSRGSERLGGVGGLADSEPAKHAVTPRSDNEAGGRQQEPAAVTGLCSDSGPGPTDGFWRAADWLYCRDGKWRSVEPGTFPLVDGSSERVVRLRGYGNAIVPQVAEQLVRAYQHFQF